MGQSTEEAFKQLKIRKNASPDTKLRAVCQWHFGDPNWAPTFVKWLQDCGYEVKEKKND